MAGLMDLLQGVLAPKKAAGGSGGMQPQANRGGLLDLFRTDSISPQAQPRGQSQGVSLVGGGEKCDFGEFLQNIAPAIAMLDPRNQQLGMGLMAMNADRRAKAEKRQNQNVTADWLQRQGVGPEEAAFLAGDKDALGAWIKDWRAGNKPDWQISTIYDDQGREQRAMIDRNTGRYNVLGNAKSDVVSPEAEAQKVRIAQAGAPKTLGSIPPGYTVEYDQQDRPVGMQPISGSPAAREIEDAKKVQNAATQNSETAGDVVLSAAKKARDLAKDNGRWAVGVGGQIMSNVGESSAAELRRQIEVLKSNAKIANLQAMRAASPTGGALGAVSDEENRMLAAKAGALEPNAGPEDFAKALDDYERNLLRIVHGKEAGDRIFDQTREKAPAPAANSGSRTRTGVQWSVEPQ